MLRPSLSIAFISLAPLVSADGARLLEGTQWLGNDGSWSTFAVKVADTTLNVLPNLAFSEVWALSSDACSGNACVTTDRGGSLPSEGVWQDLGNYSVANIGHPDNTPYAGTLGRSTLQIYDAKDPSESATIANVPVFLLEDKSIYHNFLGLAIPEVKSERSDETVPGPFKNLVQASSWFPSYSYGYTAGASYLGDGGIPGSLTLGGIDSARFTPNALSVDFTLQDKTMLPRVHVRNIRMMSFNDGTANPVTPENSFEATIDTSTPFLHLPGSVVDEMVDFLDLKYDIDLEAYTMQDSLYQKLQEYNYRWTLSSIDDKNGDNSLDGEGVLNVTISGRSLASQFRYPYMKMSQDADPVPYLAVRKAKNDDYILGRSFLQELYISTKYDHGTFTLQQAILDEKALRTARLRDITYPPGSSSLPPPGSNTAAAKMSSMDVVAIGRSSGSGVDSDGSGSGKKKLGAGAIAGIVVGAVAVLAAVGLAFFLIRRRRNRNRQHHKTKGDKLDDSPSEVHGQTKEAQSAVSFRSSSHQALEKGIDCPGTLASSHVVSPSDSTTHPGWSNPGTHPQQQLRPHFVEADQAHEVFELQDSSGPVEISSSQGHSVRGPGPLWYSDAAQPGKHVPMTHQMMNLQQHDPSPIDTFQRASSTTAYSASITTASSFSSPPPPMPQRLVSHQDRTSAHTPHIADLMIKNSSESATTSPNGNGRVSYNVSPEYGSPTVPVSVPVHSHSSAAAATRAAHAGPPGRGRSASIANTDEYSRSLVSATGFVTVNSPGSPKAQHGTG